MCQLPELKYGYADLEPCVDGETMRLHHAKHHQAYVDKLNEALEKAPEIKDRSLEDLLAADPDDKLSVLTTANQDTPLASGLRPILGIGVWEHAYYLKIPK